ncbi:MAG: DUF4411 family protein [Chlorobi bacterium CHB2]|nr:DUF4411 family protein [Chlorobi bacterium CHB2]
MPYLLDTNLFIQAKNEYYGFDICPGFWTWLEQMNRKKQIFSIKQVYEELVGYGDDLSLWTKKQGAKFFLDQNSQILEQHRVVAETVQSGRYPEPAMRIFMSGADPMLIAHALANSKSNIIVTHESRKKGNIRIPRLCDELNIKCISTFQMLRQEGVQFVVAS